MGPSPPFRSPSNGPNASAGKRCMLVCSVAVGPWRLRSKCMPRIQGPNQRRVRQSRRRCSQGTGQNAWARRAARSRQWDVRAAPYTHASARMHIHVCAGQPGRLQLACCIDAGVMGPGGKPLPVALSRAEGTGQATTTAGLEPIARNPSRRSAWVPHSVPFHPLPLPPSLARSCTPSYVLAFNIASTYAYDSVRPMLAKLMLGRVDGAGAEQKPRCASDSGSTMPFEAALEPTPTLHWTLAHGRCL